MRRPVSGRFGWSGRIALVLVLALVGSGLALVPSVIEAPPAKATATALAQYHFDDTACHAGLTDCLVAATGPDLALSTVYCGDPDPVFGHEGVTRGGTSIAPNCGGGGANSVSNSGLQPDTFTMTAYVKPSSAATNVGFLFGNGNRIGLYYDGTNKRLYGAYYGSIPDDPDPHAHPYSVQSPDGSMEPGRWHQVGIRFDGSDFSLFLDGQVAGSTSVGVDTQPLYFYGQGAITIGNGPMLASDYAGWIDELGFYDGVWSDEDIATNFNVAALLLTKAERLGCCNIGEKQLHLMKGAAGDPVDSFSGNFFETFTDLAVPGRGAGFVWTRSYNSAQAVDEVESPFGYGWTGSYGMTMTVDSELGGGAGGVWVWQENGAGIPFFSTSTGYSASSWTTSTLAVTDSGTRYTFTRNGTETIKFSNEAGVEYLKVKSIADVAGNTTSFDYDSYGYLETITDAAGRAYTVTWNSDSPKHISSVTDPIGRTVTYAYDDTASDSHLTGVTDVRGQTTEYTYDSTTHELLTIVDPLGNTVVTNEYTGGQVTTQTDALGHDTTFSYHLDAAPPYTIVTDRRGNATRYEFGTGGLVTSITRAYGCSCPDTAEWTYTYDPKTLGPATVTDPNGNTVTTSYDPDTGGVSDVGVDGITGHAGATYNDYQLPVTTKDFNQSESTNTYGTTLNWRLEGTTTPVDGSTNITTSFTYDDANSRPADLISYTDGRGNEWTQTHRSSDGLVESITDPTAEENTTTFGYDTVGRRVWTVPPRGNASGATPADFRSVALSDRAGLALLGANPLGHGVVDHFARTDSSSTLGSTDTTESWAAQSGTWGISGGAAYLVSGTNGTATVDVGNGDGIIVFAAPAAQSGNGIVFRWQDSSNYFKLTEDRATGHNYWTLTKVASGTPTTIGSTATGTCCDPGDVVWVILKGTSIKVAVNGEILGSYTSSSFTTATKVGLWADTTGAGRLGPFGWSGLNGFAATAYDRDGRAWRTINANLNISTRTYDAAGRLTTLTRPDSSTLVTVYDNEGNVTHQQDSRSGTPADTEYTYDHQNRLHTVLDPLDRETAFQYDDAGRLTTRTTLKPTTTGTYTVTYTYDDANRLTGVDYDSGGPTTADVTYTYDDNGNRLSMTDGTTGTGATCYHYDDLNRLTDYGSNTSTACDGTYTQTMGWDYDENSNITSIAYPGTNHGVTRHFDTANRMDWLTDWTSTDHITFTHDEDGNLTGQSRPNDTTATYTYDNAGATTDVLWEKSGTPNTTLGEWAYGRDPLEQITGVTSTGVGTTKTYEYNTLEQLKKVNTTTFTYDSADNPTSIGTGTISGYDAANQYTTRTTTNTVTYGWDNNGNRNSWQLNSGTPYTFTFDQENRQTAMSSVSIYTYNGDGLRVKGNVWTAITNYTWDINTPNALLTKAGDDNYIYGPGGRPLEIINTSNNKQTWLSEDQYNSTRILTDNNGTKCGDYTYDPWGNVTTHGTTTNCTNAVTGTPLQWNAQWHHGDTGYYYLRHRDYDPATGQFTSRDPLNTETRSAYGYVGNNPLNGADPSGLRWEENVRDDSYNRMSGFMKDLLSGQWHVRAEWCDPPPPPPCSGPLPFVEAVHGWCTPPSIRPAMPAPNPRKHWNECPQWFMTATGALGYGDLFRALDHLGSGDTELAKSEATSGGVAVGATSAVHAAAPKAAEQWGEHWVPRMLFKLAGKMTGPEVGIVATLLDMTCDR